MSADLLRKAAEILRERATAATPSPWTSADPEVCCAGCAGPGVYTEDNLVVETWQIGQQDADYIATMHPGVGLALADWLDLEATAVEQMARHLADRDLPDWPALAVARLILGGAS